jgi:hypothetical protein
MGTTPTIPENINFVSTSDLKQFNDYVKRWDEIYRFLGADLKTLYNDYVRRDGTLGLTGEWDVDGQNIIGIANLLAATAKFGTSVDNTEFLSDGTQVLNGEATVWKDSNFGAISLGTGASAPDRIAWRGGDIQTRAFDGNAILEQVYWGDEIQHDYKDGTDLVVHIHWAPVNANAGDVKWFVDYTVEEGGNISSGTLSVVSTAPGVAWQEQRVDIGTISGTGVTFGHQLGFRLYRDPSDAEDTYGSDAAISFTVGYHYEIDRIGSRNITSN